uniref:Uncharacterized protein n=1 Tax=Coccidioides posadasii RMSCC 3488 TaxID=454284 RepID=A0A0J6EZ87_COCPO|nr:hypothetical protein CPAG_02242 [Coccidioides posadasii RMSCC 3488]
MSELEAFEIHGNCSCHVAQARYCILLSAFFQFGCEAEAEAGVAGGSEGRMWLANEFSSLQASNPLPSARSIKEAPRSLSRV